MKRLEFLAPSWQLFQNLGRLLVPENKIFFSPFWGGFRSCRAHRNAGISRYNLSSKRFSVYPPM